MSAGNPSAGQARVPERARPERDRDAHPSQARPAGRARRRPEERPTVLFIGGFARSGSTLLDMMLGQVAGLWSTGELDFIWERGMKRNEPCGCGVRFADCPFWGAVRAAAFDDDGGFDPDAVRTLRRSIERLRNLPGLLVPALRSRDLARRLNAYGHVLTRLYRAIHAVSGSGVVVDSSKDPLHAFVLAATGRIDLHVVHLVRDSRAVAFSHQRVRSRAPDGDAGEMRRLPPGRVAFGWTLTNLLMHLLGTRARSYVRIRYREFAVRPRETLTRLLSRVGRGDDPLHFIVGEEVDLAPTHTVSGNPGRFRHGVVKVRLDAEWEVAMRPRDRRLVAALTWPLLVAYGFLPRRPR